VSLEFAAISDTVVGFYDTLSNSLISCSPMVFLDRCTVVIFNIACDYQNSSLVSASIHNR